MCDQWSSDDAQLSVIRENMDKANQVNISATLPDDLYQWLYDYSRELGVSMSAVVRSLVIAHRSEKGK